MLVIILRRVVGPKDKPSVEQFAVIGNHHRTDDRQIIRIRHVLQCLRRSTRLPFVRQPRSVGTETGGEHLGYNRYFRLSRDGAQTLIQ